MGRVGAHKVDQAVVGDIRARSHQPQLDLGALAELRLALGKTNLNCLMAYIFWQFFRYI